MPLGWQILYLYIAAVRLNGQQVARNRTQFESSLPKGKIQPVGVEVKENNTKVEDANVFNKLVELSGIDRTPEEIIADLGLEKMTNQDGEQKYWDNSSNELLDWFGLCCKFLSRNYNRRRAYIKVGDTEIYGQVSVTNRRFHMKTSIGILTMPSVFVADVLSGENKYVFFPMSALLKEEEQVLFELYRMSGNSSDDAASIEREIMRLLEKLTMAREKKPTILETNGQFGEIEEMCRASGVIKRLGVQDGKLVLEFDWRVVMDSDGDVPGLVLPPFKILIDLRSYTVRADHCYHPHVMGDYSLCMGGTLTDLVQRCINNRDLKTLVGGMIDFGNSWTSSDAGDSDRHPANCIVRYYRDNGVDWNNILVSKEDISHTLADRGYDNSDLGDDFANLFE